MKRIYAGIAMIAVLLAAAFYSSLQVQQFAGELSAELDTAVSAIRSGDVLSARRALSAGADRCDRIRTGMNHLLRTEDFTELESALRAADGYLEMNAPEDALGEVRRAQVQVETLAWLSRRLI